MGEARVVHVLPRREEKEVEATEDEGEVEELQQRIRAAAAHLLGAREEAGATAAKAEPKALAAH